MTPCLMAVYAGLGYARPKPRMGWSIVDGRGGIFAPLLWNSWRAESPTLEA